MAKEIVTAHDQDKFKRKAYEKQLRNMKLRSILIGMLVSVVLMVHSADAPAARRP